MQQLNRRIFSVPIILLWCLSALDLFAAAEAPAIASSFDKALQQPAILLARAIPSEPGRTDIGFDIYPLPDGALITGSTAASDGPPDGLLIRINREGDVLWRKSYGTKGMDLIFSALPDDSGGFVCVGFKSPSGEMSRKAMDGWILRIDNQGNLSWEQTYGGAGEDRLTSIRRHSNGWVAVGHQEMKETGTVQSWILRVDENGKETSSWIDDDPAPDKGLDVLPLPDGGSIFVGGVGAERETSDGYVIRIDASGRKRWTLPIDGSGFQVGYHLQAFQDGSFLVIGYGAVGDPKNHEAYVMRISDEGKVAYRKNIGGTTHDRATNARILNNDAVIVVGQTQRSGAQDEDHGWDMTVYALDPKGNMLWSSRYGGEGVEFGRAVKGEMGDLWIIGHTTSERTGSNAFLLRLDVTTLF